MEDFDGLGLSCPVSLIVKHLSYTQEAGRRWRNAGANPARGTIFKSPCSSMV
jgi:hypothetical protein